MKTKYLIAMVAAAATTACTTPGDVRSKAPSLEVVSELKAKDVAGCIADKLEAAFKSGVNSRPTAKGYSVWKEDDLGFYGKTTGLVIDVDDAASGSSTRLYANGLLQSAHDTASHAVRSCQKRS